MRPSDDPRRWPRPPVVVVGLDNLTGLQTARILDGRGVPVIGVAADRKHWAARTRACVDVVESPLSGEGLVAGLLRLGERLQRTAVLIPCTDTSVATVSARRRELDGHYLMPLAEHVVVEMLMDKLRFARYARSVGLPVPRTEVLAERGRVLALAPELDYPCVVKPALKSAGWEAYTDAKGIPVQDASELLSVYDEASMHVSDLLVQEWVVGPEDGLFSCNAYFADGGRPLATFVARKVRQWPPEIGISASGEECRNDEVLDTTVQLFAGIGYRGLAYLEMKRDSRTGALKIIEPNVGRPTGRSAIAEAGGVELLHTAYCDAAGLALPASREQQYVGAKWLDLRHDVQAALIARRKGTLTVREWAGSVRGPKAHAVWSRRDPAPFFLDLAQAATGARRLLATGRGTSMPCATALPTRPFQLRNAIAGPTLTKSPEGEGP